MPHKARTSIESVASTVEDSHVRSQLGFLDLPQEVKDMIYGLVAETWTRPVEPRPPGYRLLDSFNCRIFWNGDKPAYASLALVCRETYAAMVPRMYAAMKLWIEIGDMYFLDLRYGNRQKKERQQSNPALTTMYPLLSEWATTVKIDAELASHRLPLDLPVNMDYLSGYRAL
ncbi:hypothetical protein ANO11243_051080 [Dothideomycetidae sp. 11243]|nr:hypothetical protein ANO11243_051080 [fungal sp. No.11243]